MNEKNVNSDNENYNPKKEGNKNLLKRFYLWLGMDNVWYIMGIGFIISLTVAALFTTNNALKSTPYHALVKEQGAITQETVMEAYRYLPY